MKRTLLLITLGALAASLALPQEFPQGQPGRVPRVNRQGQQGGEGDVPGRAARLSSPLETLASSPLAWTIGFPLR